MFCDRPHHTSRRLIHTLAAAALALCLYTPAQADSDWVVRAVDWAGSPWSIRANADVMSLPDGRIAVGANIVLDPAAGLPVLATISPSGRFFDRTEWQELALTTSFDCDSYGNIFVAAGHPWPTGLTVYENHEGWTGEPGFQGATLGGTTYRVTLAVDQHGVPAVARTVRHDSPSGFASGVTISAFDTKTGQWTDSGVLASATTFSSPALAFDAYNRPVLGSVAADSGNPYAAPLVVQYEDPINSWHRIVNDTASPAHGVSIATGPEGKIAFAYGRTTEGATSGLDSTTCVGIYDGHGTVVEELDITGGIIAPRSLTYDAEGNLALVVSGTTLARRDASGTWTYEQLPVAGGFRGCNLTFDDDNNPYVTVYSHLPDSNTPYLYLLSKNLLPLVLGDLDISDTVDAADVAQFARAITHQEDYIADHPGMVEVDLMMLGDYDLNENVDAADAHAFCDALITTPVSGLADRAAGYFAFDSADVDPTLGDGDGNFFNTTLATAKPYAPGDSRGDLTGFDTDAYTGQADYTIDHFDVEYLLAQIAADEPDLRGDLDGDMAVTTAEVHVLLYDILGNLLGDANNDGVVSADDFAAVQTNFGATGFVDGLLPGDANDDGVVSADDFAAIQTNFGNVTPVSHGTAPIPEPTTALLLATASTACIRRRRV